MSADQNFELTFQMTRRGTLIIGSIDLIRLLFRRDCSFL